MTNFKRFQKILVIFLFLICAFYGGYYYGKRGYVFEIRKNPPTIKITNKFPPNSTVDFAEFWEVWDLVSARYLERPVDPQKMLWGAISGMVSSLDDPYTSYLPPELNETVTNAINGTYYGIGAELGLREGSLIIVAPLEGSPAKASGIRSGDRIVEIEGESTIGISITEAVSRIRGEAGTISTLTLQRGMEEPFKVYIKRGVITLDSVTWEDKGEGTAYIRINRFGGDTEKDWAKVVSEINIGMDELDAVVLDLRGNPGGYMNAAVFLADEFVKGRVPVVYQESAIGELTPLDSHRVGVFESLPGVFVLIDEGSASASEILAGALKELVGATLIGQPSFGKGTIQDAKNFSDGSGVHITIAKWLTPNKNWVHDSGITPDVIVERTSEQIEEEIDTQLDTALELAKKY